ncbi:hypothetical protein Cgig2_002906 [Carnegiea gigantea]|uniref:Uncharacterized protein n=1 Tax=Carnegiea gigantea TaxID=171969 RepID=A0A9Q1GLR5_9CARY|nr:hypothetical protein Cgig2_002906 [Carnegiea gigantea]
MKVMMRAAEFCYGCSRLGHTLSIYDEAKEVDEHSNLPYGDWHHGSPIKPIAQYRGTKIGEEMPLSCLSSNKLKQKLLFKAPLDSQPPSSSLSLGKGTTASDNMMAHKNGALLVYTANPDSQHKTKTCDLISNLHGCYDLPWLLGGDINEIFYNFEKKGGLEKLQAILDHFRDTFSAYNLHDLGYVGYEFTWWNKWDGAQSWSLLLPEAKVFHINAKISNHLPIHLRLKGGRQETSKRSTKRSFKFENMWALHEGYGEVLNELGTTREHYPQPLTWNEASKDVPQTFQLRTLWNSGMSSVGFVILNYPSKAHVTFNNGMIFSPKLAFFDGKRISFGSNDPGLISYEHGDPK